MDGRQACCPTCAATGDRIEEIDYGPTGDPIYVCGHCGASFTFHEEEGESTLIDPE